MILDKIVNQKKKELAQLITQKIELELANGKFLRALQSTKFKVIAELKSKSPSEGVIKKDYNPADIAKQYQQGGAAALSVLTDEVFFNGAFEHIKQVKAACDLPVLCKDFIIDKSQIYEARKAGADACLLIVRILSDDKLAELHQEIESLGMHALVEVFDADDVRRALPVRPKIIGINNRNLDTLDMNTDNAGSLKDLIPDDVITLSLSGAKTPEDIAQTLKQMDGVLAGTALMRSQSPEDFLIKARDMIES